MPKPKPIFHTVTKRHEGDCGVAALACLLRLPYEEVLVAAVQVVPLVLTRGLDTDEFIKIAAKFGVVLDEKTGEDIDYRTATGILGAKLRHNQAGDEHAAVLSCGLVYDPEDGKVWKVKDYLKAYDATEIDLLEWDE